MGTIPDGPPGEYIVDRLAAEAVKFVEANRDRPFFLNLWNYGVHGPWGHKADYTRRFASKTDPCGVQGNPIMASMLQSDWKARQCVAVVKDGLVTITGTGQPGTAFLGHGMGRLSGPVTIPFRVRAPVGGAGRIEWLPGGAGDSAGAQSVPFEVPAGDWQPLSVDVPRAARWASFVSTFRPAQEKPRNWIGSRCAAREREPSRSGGISRRRTPRDLLASSTRRVILVILIWNLNHWRPPS